MTDGRMRRLGAVAVALALLGGCADGKKKAGGPDKGPRPVAVRAQPVTRGDLTLSTEYPGELFAYGADVAPRTSGTLLEVPVKLGDAVKKGQVVARIDDQEVMHQLHEAQAAFGAAEANERRAQANLQLARTEIARKAPLAADQLVSAQEMSELEARVQSLQAEAAAAKAQAAQARARVGLLQEQRRMTRLEAPFDGTIAERHLDPGASVGPTTPVVRVVASGPAQVRFRVPERDLGVVREGLPIEVATAATGERTFPGTVVRMGTEVSRTDRAVQAEANLAEESPLLRSGMYAKVRVHRESLTNALLVPAIALVRRQQDGRETTGVFVAVDGTADWRPVKVLGQQEMNAAIEGPVKEGEAVLVLGHEELAPGGPIRVVNDTALPSPRADAGGEG